MKSDKKQFEDSQRTMGLDWDFLKEYNKRAKSTKQPPLSVEQMRAQAEENHRIVMERMEEEERQRKQKQ